MDFDQLNLTLGSPYTPTSTDSAKFPMASVQESLSSMPDLVPAMPRPGLTFEPASKKLKLDLEKTDAIGGATKVTLTPESSLAPVTPAQSTEFEVDQTKKHRFSGVSSDPSGRWEAYLYNSRRKIYLGNWDDEKDAARAHDRAAISIFGRQCTTINLPLSEYGDEVPVLEMLPAEQVIFSLRAEAKHRRRLSKLANKKDLPRGNQNGLNANGAVNGKSPSVNGGSPWHFFPCNNGSNSSFTFNSSIPPFKLPGTQLQADDSAGHQAQTLTVQLQKGSRVLVAPPQPLLVGAEGKTALRHAKKKRMHNGLHNMGSPHMAHDHYMEGFEVQEKYDVRDGSVLACFSGSMVHPRLSQQHALIFRPTAHLATSQPGLRALEDKSLKCYGTAHADPVVSDHRKRGLSGPELQPPAFTHNARSPFKRVEPITSSCLLSLGGFP